MAAVAGSRPDILRFLLENTNADVNARTESQRTCLHEGCYINHMEMIRLCISGVNVTIKISGDWTHFLGNLYICTYLCHI
jgi:ankyrin repeat protein